jgi:ABC-type thiamine transport system substrate-binding protein
MAEMAQEAAAKRMIQFQASGGVQQYVKVNGIEFYAPVKITDDLPPVIRTVYPSRKP